MADHIKKSGKVKQQYLFDFQDYIDDLRSDEKKKKIIEDYEKNVLKGKKITGDIKDQVWYKEYLSKFKPVPKYKVPEELEDDFDWDLLFQLVAGSFSSKYNLSYKDSLPELQISIEDDSGKVRVTKKVSDLWSFQLLKLYEIYCEEQIRLQLLPVTDNNEWNEELWNDLLTNRKIKVSLFKRRTKAPDSLHEKGISKDGKKDNIVNFYCSLESAYYILRSGKIYASDLLFMNDKEELNFGVEVMMEALRTIAEDKTKYDKDLKKWLNEVFLNTPNEEKFKNELLKDHIYIACFSYKTDDLNQWRAYGDNGKGVCIKIDFNVTNLDNHMSSDGVFIGGKVIYINMNKIKRDIKGNREWEKEEDWKKELYDIEKYFKAIKDNFDKSDNHDFVISNDVRRKIRFYKNDSFKEEEEYRKLYLDDQTNKNVSKARSKNGVQITDNKYNPKIRVSKGYLIPYIELELGKEIEESAISEEKHKNGKDVKFETAIKEITIGPAVDDFRKATRSFEEFFKVLKNDPNFKYDYSNVKINKSPIPYLP